MACPPPAMAFVTRDLQALAGVSKFGFLNGRLALTARQDDDVTVLPFSRRSP